MIKKLAVWALVLLPTFLWFWPTFSAGKLPIAFDSMVGLYHPYRDNFATEYPNGMPFRNFLVTDAFRQQYPWRQFALEQLFQGRIPWWNPYNGSGTPLLATLQAAPFYPLNIVYTVLPFSQGWTIQVVLQPILAAIGVYLLLLSLGRSRLAASLTSSIYVLSGPFVVWITWNTTGHLLALFPWVLWAMTRWHQTQERRYLFLTVGFWLSQGLAGYPQPFVFLSLAQLVYLFSFGPFKKSKAWHVLVPVVVALLLLPLYLPAMKFAALSNRATDQGDSLLTKVDWFLPPVQLLQMVVPDFFGNPATLNYVGVFNYTEFTSYIGVTALAAVVMALSQKKRDKRWFFAGFALLGLVMALPNPISRLPFALGLPLLGDSQPSRWLLLAVPCLALLSGFGLDTLLTKPRPRIAIWLVATMVGWGWMSFIRPEVFGFDQIAARVAVRNLLIPTAEVIILIILILIPPLLASKWTAHRRVVVGLLLCSMILLPGLRVASKYTPFVSPSLKYPQTQTLSHLQSELGEYRYATTDRRILPPNVNLAYKLASVELYDPLYLESYGQLLSADNGQWPMESNSFNRILTLGNFDSPILDLLGVKYVLSLETLDIPGFQLVFEEGQTRIYQNDQVWPRAFVVPELISQPSELETLKTQMQPASYELVHPNQVNVRVKTDLGGYLVVTDSYYPDWTVFVNDQSQELLNWFGLRATIITPGEHEVTYLYRHTRL